MINWAQIFKVMDFFRCFLYPQKIQLLSYLEILWFNHLISENWQVALDVRYSFGSSLLFCDPDGSPKHKINNFLLRNYYFFRIPKQVWKEAWRFINTLSQCCFRFHRFACVWLSFYVHISTRKLYLKTFLKCRFVSISKSTYTGTNIRSNHTRKISWSNYVKSNRFYSNAT